MNFKGLEIRHLAILDMLLGERHVGRAAQNLNLSQPAVSNSLAWLRRHFDDPLLVRVGNSLRLTPFAESLRAPVRALLLEFQSIAATRPRFVAEEATSHLRILMSEYVAGILLGPLLAAIARAAPRMTVECVGVESDVNEFQRGKVDLMVLPWEIMYEHHGREPLFRDRWVCLGCARAGGWPKTIDRDTYIRARHLLPVQPQSITADLQALGIERDVAAYVPYALIPDIIVGTPWLATVPFGLLGESDRSHLHVSDLPFSMKPQLFGQQWHVEAERDPQTIWLRGIVRDVANALHLVEPVGPEDHGK